MGGVDVWTGTSASEKGVVVRIMPDGLRIRDTGDVGLKSGGQARSIPMVRSPRDGVLERKGGEAVGVGGR